MDQLKFRAVFMRGGTSRALIFHRADLPANQNDWAPVFLAALGSPDPNGRQIDGMGGGSSSLSKVCVVGPSSRPDADVDYTFAQISIREARVDYSGNCGNMSSAIGPFAVQEHLVAGGLAQEAVVRIHNTNTHKIIVSRFPLAKGEVVVDGTFELEGVAGTGAPIRLEFLSPGGAGTGRLLPTGHVVDELTVPGFAQPLRVSLVDAANPGVFIRAHDIGLAGVEMPGVLDENGPLLQRLEALRRAAIVKIGMAATTEEAGAMPSIPKVGIVSPPQAFTTLSGKRVAPEDIDLTVRMISLGQPHRAVPLTGALCLSVAARLEGSVVHAVARPPRSPDADLRLGQPSGLTVVSAQVRRAGQQWVADHAVVVRTARRLMEGFICVPASCLAGSAAGR